MEYLYQKIVDEIQSKGMRIIHRKLSDDYGRCYWNKKMIVINSSIRGKLIGCIVLYHEFRHVLDYRHNRHRLFYNYQQASTLNIPRHKKINIVWKVEMGCYDYALARLKKHGITKRDNELFKKTWVKKNILPLWVKEYL